MNSADHHRAPSDDFLSIADIARRLSVSGELVRREVLRGAFPGALNIGEGSRRHWRIPESGYRAYVEKHRPALTPQPQIEPETEAERFRRCTEMLRCHKRRRPAATGQPHSRLA